MEKNPCQSQEFQGQKHARLLLAAVKRQKNCEDVPDALKKLIDCYEKYTKCSTNLYLDSVSEDALKLKEMVEDKLRRLENSGVLSKLKDLPKFCQSNFSSLKNHVGSIMDQCSTVNNDAIAEAGHEPRQKHQLVWQASNESRQELVNQTHKLLGNAQNEENLEMDDGEPLSQVVLLTRSIYSSLASRLTTFSDVARASNLLDGVALRAFGFGIYSQQFISLCRIMAGSDGGSNREFQQLLQYVDSPSQREQLKEMHQDASLRELFKQLNQIVLRKPFYQLNALVRVCHFLGDIPGDYKVEDDKLCLEAIHLAAYTFLLAQSESQVDEQYIQQLQIKINLMMTQFKLVLSMIKPPNYSA